MSVPASFSSPPASVRGACGSFPPNRLHRLLGLPKLPPPPITPTTVVRKLPPHFVDDGDELKWEFRVTNATGHPVQFERIEHSCGCMAATLGSMALAAGDSTDLVMKVDAKGRTGSQRFTARLFTKDGDVCAYETVVVFHHRLKFEPDYLAFGLVDPGKEISQDAVLVEIVPEAMALPEFHALDVSCPLLSVTKEQAGAITRSEGTQQRRTLVHVRLTPSTEQASMGEAVTCRYALSGQEKTVKLPVRWQLRDVYAMTPPRAYFGEVRGAEPVSREIVLKRCDGKSFLVRGVETHNAAVACVAKAAEGGASYRLTITLQPDLADRFCWGEVDVTTDRADQAVVKAPYSAIRSTK